MEQAEPIPTAPWAAEAFALLRAQPSAAAEWDRFVDQHPQGRFSHLWGYRQVLEEAYGYRCAYFRVTCGKALVGVFPSIVVRRGMGRLVSQPFTEYGGPLIQKLPTERCVDLVKQLLGAAAEEGCRSVEIRGGPGCEAMAATKGCVAFRLHSYATLALADADWLWKNALNNEARKGVRRAEKAGFTAEIRHGSPGVEAPFYCLYLTSMKRLGVPPHPLRYFTSLATGFCERLVAAWVMDKGTPVAVLLGAVAGKRVQIFVTASDPQAWPLRPNDLAHWELIRWAASVGLEVFDFGSARYPGQIQFKKKWGACLHDYMYYVLVPPASGRAAKIETVRDSSPFVLAMSWMWQRFVPLKLTPLVGPPIRKYLTK
jgi:CelD/BcsL family acetyltransferase involved in cellulose biosynthesis